MIEIAAVSRRFAARPATSRGLLVSAYLGLAISSFLPLPETLVLALPLALYACWAMVEVLRGRAAEQDRSVLDTLEPRLLAAVGAITMVVCLALPPGNPPRPIAVLIAFDVAVAALIVASVAAVRGGGSPGRWIVLLMALYLIAGLLMMQCPPTRIDVFALQQAGARSLLAGQDPYQLSIPNPYDAQETLAYFGNESRVLTHYPYPPLSLWVTTLGYLLVPDVRLVYLALQLGIGFLLWRLSVRSGAPPERGMALLALHLIHPRSLFMAQQTWTEPLMALSFGLLLLSAGRRRSAGALALFFASKQHSVLLLPLLIKNRRIIGTAGIALGVLGAIALTAPLALWHPPDFVEDVLLFQLQQPFRMDSLSVPAAIAWLTGLRLPGAIAPVVALGAALWARRRMPPGPHGLALSAALVYCCFFLAAKQAFLNYYYLVGVLLLFSIATAPAPEEERDRSLQREEVEAQPLAEV